ncbi:ATP-dependent RNA helicase HrpA [Humidisolicoccus flavus]|uniref:ATP-dependent RNA helicase HrpA n=1 Tax=Humidisolicoccus flavus TaxID=3111414 RepID=UPI003245EF5B
MKISFPEALPVSAARDEIRDAISANQVVVIAGATGSGKTTQLPKILLEMGRTAIAHTQPRRIAARTIAERVAEELEVPLGAEVGYQVRFTDTVSAATLVTVMTDGILLNRIHRDRLLKQYDTIIIDEAHERSLTIDFLLGYLRRILPQRPDLKVIITSATIDPQSFSEHFGGAPIIEVSGRTFPVEIRYRPLFAESSDDDGEEPEEQSEALDPIDGIRAAVTELEAEAPGDVLVFLAGEQDIRDTADALSSLPSTTEVLPLYGRLSSQEQHRVFERSMRPGVRRRIILSTNVAETSLTVPGIRYVVDAGTARISRYSARSKVQRLPIEAISQASANQRAGRAGRVAPGVAIRLYSEEDFTRRPEFTDPEVLRTSLASVILQASSLGLGPLEEFPFLQPPDSRGIKDGKDLLRELGAITSEGKITKLGRELSRLPLDPRFARMVIEANRTGVVHETIAIVAALSIQDPRERPVEKREHANQLHARFTDPGSDFISFLRLWQHLQQRQASLSGNQFRKEVKSEYLNFMRIREWQDVVRQLSRAIGVRAPAASEAEPSAPDVDAIHKALLSGLLSRIGVQQADGREFVGSRNAKFVIFPGSVLAKKPPRAVMAAEFVETSRLFARTVAKIDLAWAEAHASELVKRQYGEPRWEKRQGAAIVDERVTLFGVPIVEKRRVQYARINPQHARELFIRHALVEGEWDSRESFVTQNAALRRELEQLEERQRRRDILIDDESIVEFYEERIPESVVSVRTFEGWWRQEKRSNAKFLTMRRSDLLGSDGVVDDALFPKQWQQGDAKLALRYRFEPGTADDGVSVHIPVALLARLSPTGFDWQVPGLREELIVAMIRSLPKHIRKHVVPAGDFAKRFASELPNEPDERALASHLASKIARLGTNATAEDFDESRIPAHLQMNYVVLGGRGKILGSGKSLELLQERFKDQARDSVVKAALAAPSNSGLERDRVDRFDTALPEHVDIRQHGSVVRAFPAYTPNGDGTIGVRLHTSASERDAAQHEAVTRMLIAAVPSPASYVRDHLTGAEKLALGASPYPTTAALFDDIMLAIIDDVLAQRTAPVRSPDDFEAARAAVSERLVERMLAVTSDTAKILASARDADKAIRGSSSLALMATLAEAREHLGTLVHAGFVREAGITRLPRVDVYVRAITHRVSRLAETMHRDRVWAEEIATATAAYTNAGGSFPLAAGAPEHLQQARWMLEELRVSLFAQPLGTAGSISSQRIMKVLRGAS